MYLEQDGTAYFIDDSNESENFTDESLSEIDKRTFNISIRFILFSQLFVRQHFIFRINTF